MFNQLIIVLLCFIKVSFIFVSCSIPLIFVMVIVAYKSNDKAINRKLCNRIIRL